MGARSVTPKTGPSGLGLCLADLADYIMFQPSTTPALPSSRKLTSPRLNLYLTGGLMFCVCRKRFSGSYFCLSNMSRS
jgi:hypothetical protein